MTEKTNNTHIAFIGLGNMGGPMAKNLLKHGYNVTVFDLSEQAQQQLADAGAKTSSSPQEAVKGAQVVITMLPASKHVKTVYLGDAEANELTPQGLLSDLASALLSLTAPPLMQQKLEKWLKSPPLRVLISLMPQFLVVQQVQKRVR